MKSKIGIVAILAGVIASPVALGLSCGETLTRDTTLTEDLTDCPDTGLLVTGGTGMVIDLNGHTISGAKGNNSAGVMIVESKGVKVIGGTITGFSSGVAVNDSRYVTVENLDLDNLGEGVYLLKARSSKVIHSRFKSNFTGVAMDSEGTASGNEVLNNDFIGNSSAVLLRQSNDNRVSHNTFRNNTGAIGLTSSSANEVVGNGIYDNVNGISISQEDAAAAGANSNLIQGNKLYNNNLGLILYVPPGHANYNKYNHIERNAFRGGVTGVDIGGLRNYRTIVRGNSFYAMTDRAVDDRGTRTELSANSCSDSSC
ncbi:MAG: nitrous oxide reductase family maturation protein NosD [Pseudomonadales bacterium]